MLAQNGMKAEIIKDVINNFRESARQQMLLKNPALRDRAVNVQRDKMRTLSGQ